MLRAARRVTVTRLAESMMAVMAVTSSGVRAV